MANQPQTQGSSDDSLHIQLWNALESLEACCASWNDAVEVLKGSQNVPEPGGTCPVLPVPCLVTVLKDSPQRIRDAKDRLMNIQEELISLLTTGTSPK